MRGAHTGRKNTEGGECWVGDTDVCGVRPGRRLWPNALGTSSHPHISVLFILFAIFPISVSSSNPPATWLNPYCKGKYCIHIRGVYTSRER